MISGQLCLFFFSILYGMILGMWYDFFRALRKKIVHKDRAVHIEDLFYVLTAAFGLFLFFQIYNEGRLRFYCFLGIFCGMAVYFFLFSRLITGIFCMSIGILLWVQKGVCTVFFTPLKLIVKSSCKSLKKMKKTIKIIRKSK